MRVAIYGAGSLGTILGAYIAKAGEKIELINRNQAHIEALQSKGAQVVGTVQFTQPVTAYTPDKMSSLYDILFLMTKQQHNAEVVEMLKKRMYAWIAKREKETGRTAPIYTNFLRPEGPFKTSEEAYMGKYIGSVKDAVKLQKK